MISHCQELARTHWQTGIQVLGTSGNTQFSLCVRAYRNATDFDVTAAWNSKQAQKLPDLSTFQKGSEHGKGVIKCLILTS